MKMKREMIWLLLVTLAFMAGPTQGAGDQAPQDHLGFKAKDFYRLTLYKVGTGDGTVTSNPAGIDCGVGCTTASYLFPQNDDVDLTATADGDSGFVSWSGYQYCGESPTCRVTMDRIVEITATFNREYLLTVHTVGGGSVTSSPPGINCGSDCTEKYDQGTQVELTATPAAGWRFGQWSDDCSGKSTTDTVRMDQPRTCTATFIREYTLTVYVIGNGTVTRIPPGTPCGPGCTKYDSGTSVELTATPAAGWRFGDWSGDCSGTVSPLTITMGRDKTCTATFIRQYTLTVVPDGCGSGTVTSSPAGIDCPTDCTEKYDAGTPVTLTAKRDLGNGFGGWSGDGCSGILEQCTVTMDRDRTVTATFISVYTLNVARDGSGTGTVTGGGIDCGSICDKGYECETSVTLTAIPDPDSRLADWSESGCKSSPPAPPPSTCTVTMNSTKTVTATFNRQHLLTVNKVGSGTVTSNPLGINCGPDCTKLYDQGTNVTLTATAAAGWRFDHWSGDCSGTGAVTLDQPKTCTATFIRQHDLTVNKVGNGTVTSNPPGINCGPNCTAPYDVDTSVTLTAKPDAGWRFDQWSGDCSETGTVTMDGDKTCTATFIRQYLLTVNKAGTGTGTVTSSPPGIVCGAECTKVYDSGTMVTLTATPDPCSDFAGWSGACSESEGPCQVTMNQAKTVTATFNLKTFTLTVLKTGNRDGTVTSDVGEISCPSQCTEDYICGTVVMLSGIFDESTTDLTWSTCGQSKTCSVTINEPTTIIATFNVKTFPLTVLKDGTGDGIVTSSPPGIYCGEDCSKGYEQDTPVTLTAIRAAGSRFGGWSEPSCGSAPTCAVTMDQAKTITATFIRRHLLAVAKLGRGDGTVTSSPPGISCGTDCTQAYDQDAVVTLTAEPEVGTIFGGWSEPSCGLALTCTVTMDQAKTITAAFTIDIPLLLTKAGSGEGTVTSDPPGIDCGPNCTTEVAEYSQGTTVTVTAAETPGSRFDGWSGHPSCGSESTCTVDMNAGVTLIGTFIRRHLLTVSTDGSGTGTVTIDPPGIDCRSSCTQDYDHTTVVRLTATEDQDSIFGGWGGTTCGMLTTCEVAMLEDKTITATFTIKTPLRVTKDGTGTGTVTSNLDGIDCGPKCETQVAEYALGEGVKLTAVAAAGSIFDGWSEECETSPETPFTCTVTVSSPMMVTASFNQRHALTVTKNGTGTVTSSPPGIDCGSQCEGATAEYNQGILVSLTATADAGWFFGGWSKKGCGTSPTCQVTMDEAKTITAIFTPNIPLTVNKAGTGDGTVIGTPPGVNDKMIHCPPGCTIDTVEYDQETQVTLTAVPDASSVFVDWTGATCTTDTCMVHLTRAEMISATFSPKHLLTVIKAGTSDGTVTSISMGTDPEEIDCGPACTAAYPHETLVTLIAEWDRATTLFDGWSGGCTGEASICQVTMTQAETVTATFNLWHRLTVLKDGSGDGTVTSAPWGIDCGSDCTHDYAQGTKVTLIATPADGSRFAGWSEATCISPTCEVEVAAATTVIATFIRIHPLTVTKNGSGSGTVTSVPAGIDCGATCTAIYDQGREVTLTAQADPSSHFIRWSDPACDTSPTCTVIMSGPLQIEATFTLKHDLTVIKAGTGDGTVTSTPEGLGSEPINCPPGCREQTVPYLHETAVTLVAVADEISTFDGWSEPCGESPFCTVTMAAATTLTASFTINDQEPPSVALVSPVGGENWELSDPDDPNTEIVAWSMTDDVRICRVEVWLLYSNDGGATWPEAGDGELLGSFGSGAYCDKPGELTSNLVYTIPEEYPSGTAGSFYKIRVKVTDYAGKTTTAESGSFLLFDPQTEPRTLILWHSNRMRTQMGVGDTKLEELALGLVQLAAHPNVQGRVIDLFAVESDVLAELYEDWDENPGDAVKANAVLFGVNGVHDYLLELLEEYEDVEYLILVGDDRILPMARLIDRAVLFPEWRYTVDPDDPEPDPQAGLTRTGTTVGQALYAGRYLSDDPLTVRVPLGTTDLEDPERLFLPELMVGRLVETPQEITGAIATFLSQDGVLDLTALDPLTGHKVLVTGYDFLKDSAHRVEQKWKSVLGSGTVDAGLIGQDWGAWDLFWHLSGKDGERYGIMNLNGHGSHFAEGVPGESYTDIRGLEALEIYGPDDCGNEPSPSWGGPLYLAGGVAYGVGCHGGLPVPDTCATDPEHSLDLPQTMLARGVLAWIANSGYGWGFKKGIGLSERLIVLLTRELTAGGTVVVGEALRRSKVLFFFESPRFDAYDLKSSMQWTLHGFPMYEIHTGIGASRTPARFTGEPVEPSTVESFAGVTVERHQEADRSSLPDYVTQVNLRFNFTAQGVYSKRLSSGDPAGDVPGCPDPEGCYYELNGYAEAETDLPLQPTFVYDSTLANTSQHGILWKGGAYREEGGIVSKGRAYQEENPWIPIIGQLVSNGGVNEDLAPLPQKIFVKTRGGRRSSSGEDNCRVADGEINGVVVTTGELIEVVPDESWIQRLHDDVDLEVFYLNHPTDPTANCDREGPVFGFGPFHKAEGLTLNWTVDVGNEADVWRVVAVYDYDADPAAPGPGRWQPVELTFDQETKKWQGSVELPAPGLVTYLLEAVDYHGNVSWLEYESEPPPSGVPLGIPWAIEVTLVREADLALEVGVVNYPRALDATVTVTNHGPNVAHAVRVTIDHSPGLHLGSTAGDGWSCYPETATALVCTLDVLDVGVTSHLHLAMNRESPPDEVALTRVSVRALERDPNHSNNQWPVFVFADGFESGDLSMWSSWVVEEKIVLAAGDPAAGSHRMVRFSLDLRKVWAAGPGNGTVRYDVVDQDGRALAVLELIARGGRLTLVGAIAAGDDVVFETPYMEIDRGRETIELEWVVQKDGGEPVALWVDGMRVWDVKAAER